MGMKMVKKIVVGDVDKDQLTAYEQYLNELAAATTALKNKLGDLNSPNVFLGEGFVKELKNKIENLEGKWVVIRNNNRKTLKAVKKGLKEMPA